MVWCGWHTRNRPVHGQTWHADGHQQLIGHRVDDRPDNRLQAVSPGDIPVDQIGDACVGEQRQGDAVLVVDEEVANQRGHGQAGEGEDVRDGVDVFVSPEGDPGEDPRLFGLGLGLGLRLRSGIIGPFRR